MASLTVLSGNADRSSAPFSIGRSPRRTNVDVFALNRVFWQCAAVFSSCRQFSSSLLESRASDGQIPGDGTVGEVAKLHDSCAVGFVDLAVLLVQVALSLVKQASR